MTPVITLTTDFGAAGPFVGVMKAVVLQHAPAARIHDLTHHIAPWQPGEAGFWLSRCYRYFPAGSVHVVVVDPGVGTTRAILACAWDGHLFLAPDNGVLPMVVGPGAILHALSSGWLDAQGWPAPSQTFHGRDIFAPLAAALTVVSPLDSPFTEACACPFASVTAEAGATLAIPAFPLLKATGFPATGAPFWVTVALAVVVSLVCRSLLSSLKDTARGCGG